MRLSTSPLFRVRSALWSLFPRFRIYSFVMSGWEPKPLAILFEHFFLSHKCFDSRRENACDGHARPNLSDKDTKLAGSRASAKIASLSLISSSTELHGQTARRAGTLETFPRLLLIEGLAMDCNVLRWHGSAIHCSEQRIQENADLPLRTTMSQKSPFSSR